MLLPFHHLIQRSFEAHVDHDVKGTAQSRMRQNSSSGDVPSGIKGISFLCCDGKKSVARHLEHGNKGQRSKDGNPINFRLVAHERVRQIEMAWGVQKKRDRDADIPISAPPQRIVKQMSNELHGGPRPPGPKLSRAFGGVNPAIG